jgi:MYXO-CTERM domain-containing protein
VRPTPTLACALLSSLFIAGSAAAQTQVKPYFLVVFDTSGSMDSDVRTPTNSANSCGYGGADPSKMEEAKCALGKLVNATGDADFGLMQFAQTWNGTGSCSAGTCRPQVGAGLLRVPIQSNTAPLITALIDNAGTNGTQELCPNGYTPLGGVLMAAKTYFESGLSYTPQDATAPAASAAPAPTAGDPALACRPLSVILLTDGVECCSGCVDTDAEPFDDGCPTANPVLSAAGVGMCTAACGYGGGCGNSGDLEAFESAPEKAYQLLNAMVPSANGVAAPRAPGIQTYVIGFGMSETGQTADEIYQRERVERIAVAGGTDNPSDGSGGSRAFYAADEAGLALAFSQIIADAQPPSEICNNADDDCDTLIDEGIPKYCNKPGGIDMPELCDPQVETLCDNEDDDCDGLIDEGVLNGCGVCGDPPAEVCDGVDNDCDSRVDEMTEGGACGSDVGRCEEGELRCIGGMQQCRGEVPPRDEICNCEDDDCDGEIDEDITGDLCPDGRCIACECVPRCDAAEEFMPVCDDEERTPQVQENGECFCIIDTCDSDECEASTLEREDEVACAPDDPLVSPCLCRAGMCGARCDGITCGVGDTCNRRTGQCVEDNCRGFGCPVSGELCDPLSAECVEDPCASVTCESGEVCRDGECERSCAGVRCEVQETCRAGRCIEDLCAEVRCGLGELCDPRDGECVDSPCLTRCEDGLVCSVEAGECDRDPCWNVHCPRAQVCRQGECVSGSGTGGTAGSSGGGNETGEDLNERVLAAGGGGCACNVAGGEPPGGGPARGLWAVGLLGVALLLRARRRRSRAALFGAVSALAVVLGASACRVSPFCIDCVDGGNNGQAGDGSGGSGGQTGEDGGPNEEDGGGAGSDGGGAGNAGEDGGPPRCTQPEPETCDGTDQDCDFIVDEDVEADDNDCVQFGLCAGTRPLCVAGEFICRYPDEREDDETLCDAIDNDCDNRVDESHPALGTACNVGVGACQTAGEQVCGEDGIALRCEGTPLDAGDEVCDGLDNDCDGDVDEPKSAPGSNASYVVDDVVQISTNLFIYRYEASRPDAVAGAQGLIASRACSRAGVMPWTNLTFEEAQDACAAADMELCSEENWEAVCDGPLASNDANRCGWGYTPAAGSCPTHAAASDANTSNDYPTNASPAMKQACNGHDLTAMPGGADVDVLAATGSYPRCFVALGGESVFDLSGNAKEWTVGPDSPAENPLKGGSYNNLPGGMRCNFDFAVAGPAVRLRNVGFRCCSSSQP